MPQTLRCSCNYKFVVDMDKLNSKGLRFNEAGQIKIIKEQTETGSKNLQTKAEIFIEGELMPSSSILSRKKAYLNA